jgi:hypothetical protein
MNNPAGQAAAADSQSPSSQSEPPLRSSTDDSIDLYNKDVDRTLLRAKLGLSVTERIERFEMMVQQLAEIHEAGRRHRGEV